MDESEFSRPISKCLEFLETEMYLLLAKDAEHVFFEILIQCRKPRTALGRITLFILATCAAAQFAPASVLWRNLTKGSFL